MRTLGAPSGARTSNRGGGVAPRASSAVLKGYVGSGIGNTLRSVGRTDFGAAGCWALTGGDEKGMSACTTARPSARPTFVRNRVLRFMTCAAPSMFESVGGENSGVRKWSGCSENPLALFGRNRPVHGERSDPRESDRSWIWDFGPTHSFGWRRPLDCVASSNSSEGTAARCDGTKVQYTGPGQTHTFVGAGRIGRAATRKDRGKWTRSFIM